MKAMVLAAGFGTRLGELTKTTPKCLMEVGNETILDHVVGRLKKVGVTELVINLHYLPEQVKAHLEKRDHYGCTCHLLHEHTILGTGGGIKNAASILQGTEPFFVHNADVYSEIDLSALRSLHDSTKACATLAVMKRETSRALLFDQDMNLIGWRNAKERKESLIPGKGSEDPWAFSGVQILSPSILPVFNRFQGEFSSISAYLEAALEDKVVKGYDCSSSRWVDIGTPAKLNEARALTKN